MKVLFQPDELALVGDYIRQGKVFGIPTETVYGLAANIHCDDAVAKIYSLKQRPKTHPLIIHISSQDDLSYYATSIPDYVYQLAKSFWPGPLTLVLPKSQRVSDWVTAGQDTVGIRMPSHPLAHQLIKVVGSPLAAPSANRFGRISPTMAAHVLTEFNNEVPVLEGGACPVGIESTIIDATSQKSCAILRPGILTCEDIQKAIPGTTIIDSKNKTKAVSGTLKYHYAASKPSYLFKDKASFLEIINHTGAHVFVICLNQAYQSEAKWSVCMPDKAQDYAQKIYDQLRIADESSSDAILIEMPPQTSAWAGVIDRIKKATAKSMEEWVIEPEVF